MAQSFAMHRYYLRTLDCILVVRFTVYHVLNALGLTFDGVRGVDLTKLAAVDPVYEYNIARECLPQVSV